MRREWEPEDLIAAWTLLEDDRAALRNKSGANRLGFAALLKYFEIEARFPAVLQDVPSPAVEYVAHQVGVDPGEFAKYDLPGRAA